MIFNNKKNPTSIHAYLQVVNKSCKGEAPKNTIQITLLKQLFSNVFGLHYRAISLDEDV